MSSRFRYTPVLLLAVTTLPGAMLSYGQADLRAQPAAPGRAAVAPETAAVARAWALLGQGDAAGASAVTMELVAKYPRSAAVLVLGVDVEIAGRGAIAGLHLYERWLGQRTVEDGYALRRVAHALLREMARGDGDRGHRVAAVDALLRDGDSDAAAVSAPVPGAPAGNQQNIDTLLVQLKDPGPAKRIAIMLLARERTKRAVAPLIDVLGDPDPMVRAAAADALGGMGATQAVPALRRLLEDTVYSVRFSAASALLGLNDASGLPWLRQQLTSEHRGIRVAAARATRSEAGPEWLTVVRALTKEDDPEIRRQAAELVAAHDPELARATIEPLLNDANPAMRQAAADSYVTYVTSDFGVLRRYLRGDDPGTRVRAADRILELTR